MRLLLRRFPAVGLLLFALLPPALAGPTLPHGGTYFPVTNTNDSGPGSLRNAISLANDGDSISFVGLNGQTIALTSGELLINKTLAINGPGSNLLTVSRNPQAPAFRIFHVVGPDAVTITGLTVTGGSALGAGIWNEHATLNLRDCIIQQNLSPGNAGGIHNDGSGGSATLIMVGCTVSANSADSYGGGIFNLAFNGGTAVLALWNSSVTQNHAYHFDLLNPYGYGAGIYSQGQGASVTLTNSTVSLNVAGTTGPPVPSGSGGGVSNRLGTLTIMNSTINDNQSGFSGGGIENSGALIITNSSLFRNSTLGASVTGPFGLGGGVYSIGMVTITNSTLTDNYAALSGGGIFAGSLDGNSRLTISNSTLSSNRADQSGGGIINYATLEIGDTILETGSTGANILNNGGTVTSHGYNLSSDNGGGYLTAPGDQINIDPLLGPLQDNGGPTFTHELLPGSPAINAGDPNFTPPPWYDQRGFGYSRVFNGRLDIGSLEVRPPFTPTPPPPTPTPPCGDITFLSENFDAVSPPALPVGWISTFTNGPANCTPTGTCALGTNWVTEPGSAFHDAPGCVTDSTLDTLPFNGGATNGTVLFLDFSFDLEEGRDGAVLEISINGGPFVDFVAAGGGNLAYNGTISTAFHSPIAGRPAWTGKFGVGANLIAQMPAAGRGEDVRLRFRLATDCAGASTGFRINSILVSDNVGCESPTPSPSPPTPTPTATATATPIITPTPTPPTLIVTNTNDSGPGSLRQALADAHDGDIIGFDPALNGQVVSLTSDELAIDKNVTINGPGQTLLAVSRDTKAAHFRVFHVLPGRTVTIKNLTISGGDTYLGGAGIWNEQSTLTLDSCTVRDNLSHYYYGGGISNDGFSGKATLTILNSTIRDNDTEALGGDHADGGGIYNAGSVTLTIENSSVTWNTALYTSGPTTAGGHGGGIYIGASKGESATLTITNSSITHNRAGPPNDYNLDYRGGYGGGIANHGALTTITNSSISDNEAGFGGGGIDNSGTLAITNSTISGNRGISVHDGIPYGYGGAIINSGPLTITNTTLSNNGAGQAGGALSGAGFIITNSTISGNGSGDGGAIYGSGTITNSTISGNTANQGGGIYATGAVQLGNTILKAGNSGANILNGGGSVTSHGYNLSSDDGGGVLTATGDQINTDPIFGPLQDNGGPTFTHALLPGSPAIDAGDPNFTPPPSTDQRGYLRVFNGRIDIGSFEAQPVPTPTPTPTPTPFTAQLANISTRLRVETGDNIGIGGFIIHGAGTLQVALRGIGPSLGQQGIPDFLPDPILELRDSTGALLVQNDNWQDDPAAATQLTQLGLAPSDPTESALIVALPPGAYTAMVTGKNGGTGIGLVEVYNVDHSVPVGNVALVNISTRGFVQTGNNVMIGGFILTGASSENAQVAIRGIGPSLTQFGVSNALADPTLELHDGNGATLISNDNWQDDQISAAQLTAHGLAPSNPNESGIFASLPPGLYTATLAGKNGGTGVGLIEIYNLQ